MPIRDDLLPELGEEVATPDVGRRLALTDAADLIDGVGPKRAALLASMGVRQVRDLLHYFPRDYVDRREVTPIGDVVEGATRTVQGEVVSSRAIRLRGRNSMTEVVIRDATGKIKATWFGRGYLAGSLTTGKMVLLTGRVGKYRGPALQNPDYELLGNDEDDLLNTGRIVPVYRLGEGLSQRMLRRWIREALDAALPSLTETLPATVLKRHGFPGVTSALFQIHFPDSVEQAKQARDRFAFEELLRIQLEVMERRRKRVSEGNGCRHVTGGRALRTLRRTLPYKLTKSQQRAVSDILCDMVSRRPMTRLLQGDVGCGKTVVALHAITAAADGGFQTAFMAPTEVLAEQHFVTLRDALEPLGISTAVLTSASPDVRGIRESTMRGAVQVVVGTHALTQEATTFRRLGLVIIDEQHRFGVGQRQRLVRKGEQPDVLHMTATPIPRSLALTLYGAMDITTIDELPPGRGTVKTTLVPPRKLEGLYGFIRDEVLRGRQCYYVCPLVEDSDKINLASVSARYGELERGPLDGFRLALLHGRLASEDKERIMSAFKSGKIDVLVSTTVIEVGIDVPNATIMVIEDASRFGLSQLHQLRGRVGRGADISYCFLLGKARTEEGKRRLDIMCATSNGFEISEADLELRGPGDLGGTQQWGFGALRCADLIRDARLLDAAQREAQRLVTTGAICGARP